MQPRDSAGLGSQQQDGRFPLRARPARPALTSSEICISPSLEKHSREAVIARAPLCPSAGHRLAASASRPTSTQSAQTRIAVRGVRKTRETRVPRDDDATKQRPHCGSRAEARTAAVNASVVRDRRDAADAPLRTAARRPASPLFFRRTFNNRQRNAEAIKTSSVGNGAGRLGGARWCTSPRGAGLHSPKRTGAIRPSYSRGRHATTLLDFHPDPRAPLVACSQGGARSPCLTETLSSPDQGRLVFACE